MPGAILQLPQPEPLLVAAVRALFASPLDVDAGAGMKAGETETADENVPLDQTDLAASLEGDEEAFANLVRRYEHRIFAQMWKFCRDREQCAELVQDVFVEAFYSLRTYRANAPFLHWLSRIATRTGYRFWKQRTKASRNVPLSEWDGAEEADDADGAHGAEIGAEPDGTRGARAAQVLYRLLERLKPADRLVLTLQYFEDCDTEEIARRTGWPQSVIKMRAFRARRRLRGWLEQEMKRETEDWSWIR